MKKDIVTKSDIIRAFAEKHSVPVIDIRLSTEMSQPAGPITAYDYVEGNPL